MTPVQTLAFVILALMQSLTLALIAMRPDFIQVANHERNSLIFPSPPAFVHLRQIPDLLNLGNTEPITSMKLAK
jgi:hypothetical protein